MNKIKFKKIFYIWYILVNNSMYHPTYNNGGINVQDQKEAIRFCIELNKTDPEDCPFVGVQKRKAMYWYKQMLTNIEEEEKRYMSPWWKRILHM